MMKTTFCIALLGLLLCRSSITLHATDNSSGTRHECPVANIPRATTWIATYTYPEELGPNGEAATNTGTLSKIDLNGRIRTIATSRLGDVTHMQITKIPAEIHDMWSCGSDEYGRTNGSIDWVRGQSGSGESKRKSPLCQCTFPGTEWVKPDLYLGKVQHQGVECHVYMPKPHPVLDMSDAKKVNQMVERAPYIAIIDTKDRLPVEIHEGGIKLVFEYKAAPRMLELPDDLVAQIAQGARVRTMMNVRAPRPY